jgi:hypothetical protein
MCPADVECVVCAKWLLANTLRSSGVYGRSDVRPREPDILENLRSWFPRRRTDRKIARYRRRETVSVVDDRRSPRHARVCRDGREASMTAGTQSLRQSDVQSVTRRSA